MDSTVNIADAPWQECNCGGSIFTQATMIKRLSAIISPDGKEHLIPIDIYLCNKCGKIPEFLTKEIPGISENLIAFKEKNL